MKIIAFVQTEYHLMLCVNEILKFPDVDFHVYIIRKAKNKRLEVNLDFSNFQNARFEVLTIAVNLNSKFSEQHISLLESFLIEKYTKLLFYQEHDPFILSVIKFMKKTFPLCEICLYQDGLKPYNRMKGYSYAMLIGDIKIWFWLLRNNIFEFKPWKLFLTKNYAYTDEVDSVFLTFPESYVNWNNKTIKKIEFAEHGFLKRQLEYLFCWDDKLMPVNTECILYMTQPTYHDPTIEFDFLQSLKDRLKLPLILKIHPLTSEDTILKYKQIGSDVFIIDSRIPAELFIMNLTNSLIVSLHSTSMLYNSPTNRYYYISNLFKSKIKHLQRYDFTESPSEHILMVKDFQDIV